MKTQAWRGQSYSQGNGNAGEVMTQESLTKPQTRSGF